MYKRFLKNIFSLNLGQLFFIGLLSLTACKDEPARLSGGVLPDGEVIRGLNEYIELGSRNVMREAVRTNDADYGLLGIFNDSVFGRTEADFVTDFSTGDLANYSVIIVTGDSIHEVDTVQFYKFNNNKPEYDDIWKVDSVVLKLQYQFNDWYGDMLERQHLMVYELNAPLGSNYTPRYSNEEVDYNPNFIGDKIVYPNDDVPDSMRVASKWTPGGLWEYPDSLLNYPQYLWDMDKYQASRDSNWIDSDFTDHTTKTKYWNIKLNDEVADRIFNIDSASIMSTADFLNIFPGVYVTTDKTIQSEGNLTRINLLGTSSSLASHLAIHFSREYKYFNRDTVLTDTLVNYTYEFPVNVENVRFNRFKHEIDDRIDTASTSQGNMYVQGMAGLYSKFIIPDEISAWADSLTLNEDYKLEGEPYRTTANIEFFLEVDTISNVPWNSGGIQRYQLPTSLEIMMKDKDGEFVTPTYSLEVNNTTVSGFIFGVTGSTGSRTGNGERVSRQVDDGNGGYRTEYLYRFIMNADYFNYLMRELDERRFENDWDLDDEEFINEFHKLFNTEYFIGPNSSTYNFRRVKLFSGAHSEKPFRMNIKYYHYVPR
ncbi:DUF4270 family protein [Carboxylicivirga linearis]|uniref:DUF4270 family protein n=1 Tax=Carboxylicivirga linearis TaxID=1628157 RepID=A0ABS5JTR8_9BACT|nr:DUF4270 family protein [Carboxylicivirga linearis]MBS2098213.1 DUF4270 family protein [Carboxylicivirga linearis]